MPNEYREELLEKLNQRRATVVVVGLGYVGLPLACALADVGHRVIGIDLSIEKVNAVSAGLSYVDDVLPSQVKRLVAAGRLRATNEYDTAHAADAVVLALPTPIDEHRVPDLTSVISASLSLAKVVSRGALIVLESTTYPGTTEEVVVTAFRDRGYLPGADLFVGYSPERIDPGNQDWDMTNTPRVVSGLTESCLELVVALYSSITKTLVPVSNIRTAEIQKLFENIFRGVNIALVNELQIICDALNIDVWEVVEACSTKPYGYMAFYPGPGLGGHCVPVDPFYLAWKARQINVDTEFIELSGRVNARMPEYVVHKVDQLLNARHRAVNGAKVGLIGVAYKKNCSDVRESPAIKLIELLVMRGATVAYHDPHVASLSVNGHEFQSQPNLDEFLAQQDCAVVVADHDSIDWARVLPYAPITVDTRNAIGRLYRHSTGSSSAPSPDGLAAS